MILPLYVFARFEPRPGRQVQLLDELMLILDPTRAELGCVRIHLCESARDPLAFIIHSEWSDEQAFDAHAEMPQMTRFLDLVDEFVTHPLQAVLTKQIA